MIKTKAAFMVYGVHKDGLVDALGVPFIDEFLIDDAKKALLNSGLELYEHEKIIATKQEAMDAFKRVKHDDSIHAVILFSGTWVWSANMLSAIQDLAKSGKAIVIWTHPGSQGWRPVGGLVLSAALKEIGLKHRFVYGKADCEQDVNRVVSYCIASAVRNRLNLATICAFGGRGMGQNCGVADPSQWTKQFGIDIDSRDTTQLLEKARAIPQEEVEDFRLRLIRWFHQTPEDNVITQRSIRLYLAMKALQEQIGFDYYTIQSFPGLGDDYAASCLMQSMMLEDGVGTSTLSDFNTLLCVILLTELSHERVYYGDLQHINKETNEIKIIGDGTIPPSLAGVLSKGKATFAEHGIPSEGSAGGLSVSLVAKSGQGVLARLGRLEGKFQMVLVRCEVFEPSFDEIDRRRAECGIPFWPHAFLKVDCNIEKLLEYWNNEYACLGYGSYLLDILKDFCDQVGIEVLMP